MNEGRVIMNQTVVDDTGTREEPTVKDSRCGLNWSGGASCHRRYRRTTARRSEAGRFWCGRINEMWSCFWSSLESLTIAARIQRATANEVAGRT